MEALKALAYNSGLLRTSSEDSNMLYASSISGDHSPRDYIIRLYIAGLI
jgi:hypothetical protein